MMNSIGLKVIFLCLATFTGKAPCKSEPIPISEKNSTELKQQFFAGVQISLPEQQQADSTEEEMLTKKLLNELSNSGVELKEEETEAIADAITKGGQGAMALATMITMQIAKLEGKLAEIGKTPTKITQATISDKYIDDILRNCRKRKYVNLALTQILVPKLLLLKEKKRKNPKL